MFVATYVGRMFNVVENITSALFDVNMSIFCLGEISSR